MLVNLAILRNGDVYMHFYRDICISYTLMLVSIRIEGAPTAHRDSTINQAAMVQNHTNL